jgi:hypothetical protein
MAQLTNVYALPYPGGPDSVDVPRDVAALAAKLDTLALARPPLVGTLPVGPVDGQEVYYQVDAAAGIVWHLRYRAASASSYKWEFVGGGRLEAEVDGAASAPVSAQVYANFTPASGPQIIVPLAGDYLLEYGCYTSPPANASGWMAAKIGAALPIDAESVGASAGTSILAVNNWTCMKKTLAAAATTILMQGYSVGSTCTFDNRRLIVTPVRVG